MPKPHFNTLLRLSLAGCSKLSASHALVINKAMTRGIASCSSTPVSVIGLKKFSVSDCSNRRCLSSAPEAVKKEEQSTDESAVAEEKVAEGEAPQRPRRRGPSAKDLEEGANPVPLHRILAQETKELIYKLHTEDPAKNSFKELGERYGISVVRVKAIVTLAKMAEEQEKRGLTEKEIEQRKIGKELQKKVEEILGTVRTGFGSRLYEDERQGFQGVIHDVQERGIKARPRPSFEAMTFPEARKEMSRLIRRAERKTAEARPPRLVEEERLEKAAAAKIPVAAIPQLHGLTPVASNRWKFVFADISQDVQGESRQVVVRDTDGKLRAASFDERLRVERHVAPPKLPRK